MSIWDNTIDQADDEQIRQALEHAHIPALMAALVHLNGNRDHFTEFQPSCNILDPEDDGLTEPQRAQVRALALSALIRFRDSGCSPPACPSEEHVLATMHEITGEQIPPALIDFLREELNLYGEDRRRVDIEPTQLNKNYRVLIIGAGMSGILAAIRLQQAGIDYVMVEKNSDIGGTWHENTYPGCQVDSANHLYDYMFEPNHQWPAHFSRQPDLFAYFNRTVEKYQLRDNIRLNTRMLRARYNENEHHWQVTTQCDDEQLTENFSAVVSAAGQLNSPKLPDIKGLDSFAGIAFHSARWQHCVDLQGKRVAVIGTGCSALQFIPEIAPQCANLTVFQRSAPWLLPIEKYHSPTTEEELWLFREVPFYPRWYRFFLFRSRAIDGHLPFLYADKDWRGPEGTIGEANELIRGALSEYLREQTGDDTELLAKITPNYPPGGKRPVLDDGSWVKALQRDNVQLLTNNIKEVVAEGIVTSDGTVHPVDIIIYGTGFKANEFLTPMEIIGKNATELASHWQGDARAYMGMTVPQFPNFYCLYGPNTNIVVGSSIIFFSECQMRYIMGCLKLQLENGYHSLECRQQVLEDYTTYIDKLNSQRAWGSTSVKNSWYKNQQGRITQNWPGTHWDYWQRTRSPEPDDYILN